MKQRNFFLFFIGLIIIIITIGRQVASVPTGAPELSGAATQFALTQFVYRTATKSAKQTATQNSLNDLVFGTPTPTSTPALSATDALVEILFHDDFDQSLQPGWEWTREKPANWSLTKNPGSLRFDVFGGYINLHNASNFLSRPAPAGSYFIETAFSFNPYKSNQFAGLVLYESDDDFMQAGVSYCDPVFGCVGQGLYIDLYQNGNLLLPRNVDKFTDNRILMRIYHEGNKFTLYTSPNGGVWYQAREFIMDLDVKRVGIFTGQSADQAPTPAIFEYFVIGAYK